MPLYTVWKGFREKTSLARVKKRPSPKVEKFAFLQFKGNLHFNKKITLNHRK